MEWEDCGTGSGAKRQRGDGAPREIHPHPYYYEGGTARFTLQDHRWATLRLLELPTRWDPASPR